MTNFANEIGNVHIADEVVGIIASIAATEVEGVKSLTGGLAGGIAELLGKKSLPKGVKVEVGEKEAAVDLNLVLHYGAVIHAVAQKVQDNVKKTVEGMTALNVVEVNVNITAVELPPKKKEEKDRKEKKDKKDKKDSKEKNEGESKQA